MLGLHNCDVWHTFARSENHNDWVKGLTSTRQEAGFTMLNAASADAVNSAKCSKDSKEAIAHAQSGGKVLFKLS